MSDYINLSLAKSHLRVLHARDDVYIESLIKAALKNIEKTIDQPLEDILVDDELPADIQFAALLIVGNLYENRSEIFLGTIVAANPAVDRLLMPYRKMGV